MLRPHLRTPLSHPRLPPHTPPHLLAANRTKKKMSVSEYIEKTELAAKVEAAVNEAVKARPDEPLSFLVSGE